MPENLPQPVLLWLPRSSNISMANPHHPVADSVLLSRWVYRHSRSAVWTILPPTIRHLISACMFQMTYCVRLPCCNMQSGGGGGRLNTKHLHSYSHRGLSARSRRQWSWALPGVIVLPGGLLFSDWSYMVPLHLGYYLQSLFYYGDTGLIDLGMHHYLTLIFSLSTPVVAQW